MATNDPTRVPENPHIPPEPDDTDMADENLVPGQESRHETLGCPTGLSTPVEPVDDVDEEGETGEGNSKTPQPL